MLVREQLRCGIYDSLVSQKNKSRTQERRLMRYELELYHTDSGISYLDGNSYPVRRGMLLCAVPGQVRCSQLPIRSSYIWVMPEGDAAWVLRQLPSCTYIHDAEAVDALLLLFARLHSSLSGNAPEPLRTVESNRLLLEILQRCLQLCRGSDSRPVRSRMIREACQYMDRHYWESCTLSEIAAYVHLSANHLHTVFLESEGCTPCEYVTKKRIEKAKMLILTGELSLAQIALETGFCSQSHFTGVFKKLVGMTPARYRKQLFDIL